MNSSILSSTLFLTLLLFVGLVFFIRAAAKDRTQQQVLVAEQPLEFFLGQLQGYFEGRGYAIAAVEGEQRLVLAGFVRPSRFLAGFLTVLAACGLFCLGLVLSLLYPRVGSGFWGLVLLAPGAGWFYWRRAGRVEQVVLQGLSPEDGGDRTSRIAVSAHRDELLALQQALPGLGDSAG